MTSATDPMAQPANLNAIKTRQQAMWASGDFAVIGTTLQIVVFWTYYGPVHKVFAALEPDRQARSSRT